MKGTPVTEESYQYIVDLFATHELELLERFQSRATERGVPMIMIGVEQAKFIAFFLKAIGAKRVLDVGTLFGYSAAVMSNAMPEGASIVSLEFNEMHAAVAKENLAAEGITNVEIIVGPAAESMKTLADHSFDFVLIDADKENYEIYLDHALRLTRAGGVIAGDNALAWGKITTKDISPSDPDYVSARAMQSFNLSFANEARLFSIIVPVGDGMVMGVLSEK